MERAAAGEVYLCGVKKGKSIVLEEVLVEDHAGEGRCLARINGKIVFIEGVVPGDIVDVRLTRSKKDWAEGAPINFRKYAPGRVTPFCEHFGICGGCQWQMLPYETQLTYKERHVQDCLQRIGKLDLPALMPIIGAPHDRYYRNKIEYTFSNRKFLVRDELRDPTKSATSNVAGFHAPGLFDKVVDIQRCHLQAEPTNRIRLAVRQFAIDNQFDFYDIRNHVGLLRTMQVRLCRSGELMVNLVFGNSDTPKQMLLLDFVANEFPEITTLLYTINEKKNDSLNDLVPQVYTGKGFVIETLDDFRFKIGPKSFFQTNTEQAEQLYRVVKNFSALTGSEVLYDLYCGTGSIGIFASQLARKIVGVDVISEAIADATENAALNGINHAQFVCGDVADICTSAFFEFHGRPNVIVTDPPRAGMHDSLVQKIMEMEAPTVVYVSCNPATQARDLSTLAAKYSVTAIQPVDMFPHTQHIENVVQLKLKK